MGVLSLSSPVRPGHALAPTAFSSAAYASDEDRARAWRRALARAFAEVELTAWDAGSFPAFLTAEWNGGVQIATEESGPATIVRGARGIAADPRRPVLARLQVEGETVLIQDGRTAVLRRGSLALYDAGRPFKLVHPGRQRAHIVTMPRALVRLDESALGRVTATLIAADDHDDAAAALPRLAAGLIEELAVAKPAVREHFARAAADVVGCAVAHHVSRGPVAPGPRQALLERIKADLEDRLADPGLTPQAIADQHHISVRYLQVLFQQQGLTVNGWVRARRLEGASLDLAGPDAHRRSVAAVAARWGFTNSSHFSRAFREAFGMSPMQWRRLGSGSAAQQLSGSAVVR